jgi:hypothetical protein
MMSAELSKETELDLGDGFKTRIPDGLVDINKKKKPSIAISLKLVVKDKDGNILNVINQPADLAVKNLLIWLATAIGGFSGSTGTFTGTITNMTTNSNASINPVSTGTGNIGISSGQRIQQCATTTIPLSSIYIGSGTGTASFTDGAPFNAASVSNGIISPSTYAQPSSSSNTFFISGTWTNPTASAITITEAIYFWGNNNSGPFNTGQSMLFTHDTFNGVSVPASGTVTATITFTFN